ncbi:MAG: ATP-dependent DNA helicase RecG [Nitrospiraceae bacterium]
MPGPQATDVRSRVSFLDLLSRLGQPLEFAARENFSHLPTTKHLGGVIQRQACEVLALGPHPVFVEVRLLALRTLFESFDTQTDNVVRRSCVEQGRALLRQLRGGSQPTAGAVQVSASLRSPQATTAISSNNDGRAFLSQSVQFLKGVGPRRAQLLQTLGIATIEDLLWTLPWRYDDKRQLTQIAELAPGTQAMVCGVVRQVTNQRLPGRRLSILRVGVEDATGGALATLFNQPYLEDQLTPGVTVLLSGRVPTHSRTGRLWAEPQLEVAEHEIVTDATVAPMHLGKIVPVYHETRGWSSRAMRSLVGATLPEALKQVEDPLPDAIRRRHHFPPLVDALRELHQPVGDIPFDEWNGQTSCAHRRLAFEELFLLELALAQRRSDVRRATKPYVVHASPRCLQALRALLPYSLTQAQERVIADILGDLSSPHPMNRLLQGDVGCGKTVVAFHALMAACTAGYQAALMVPTELLAEQHAANLAPLAAQLGMSTVLLSGKERGVSRRERLEQIAQGTAQLVIGTHALLQPTVNFAKLALVVVDEQHKFGVVQRKTLVEKGYQPDVLILTATPIPRTLAMTVYGDLDVSVIDALPPGRRPIRTMVWPQSQRRKAYELVRQELRAGRQAYVVFPLVEESEKVDLEAAQDGWERIQREECADFRVGLIHGRQKADDRAATMAAFKAGDIHVLVATTVIEVGVDVPNATVMVVEHAERFGLAQLHQLRGRVGRGAQQSFCVLVPAGAAPTRAKTSGAPATPSQQRLEALVCSTDGFVIAEEDLRIRGPGEMFGTRQSGLPEFRVANLVRDVALLELARKEARSLLDRDPTLDHPEHRSLKQVMQRRWAARVDLGEVS